MGDLFEAVAAIFLWIVWVIVVVVVTVAAIIAWLILGSLYAVIDSFLPGREKVESLLP